MAASCFREEFIPGVVSHLKIAIPRSGHPFTPALGAAALSIGASTPGKAFGVRVTGRPFFLMGHYFQEIASIAYLAPCPSLDCRSMTLDPPTPTPTDSPTRRDRLKAVL